MNTQPQDLDLDGVACADAVLMSFPGPMHAALTRAVLLAYLRGAESTEPVAPFGVARDAMLDVLGETR